MDPERLEPQDEWEKLILKMQLSDETKQNAILHYRRQKSESQMGTEIGKNK